jgi:hypothetical protein
MTIKPFWITKSGSLGSFNQDQLLDISLESANTNQIELISGEFPRGVELTRIQDISKIVGKPFDSGVDKTYNFVLRASNNTGPNNTKVVQDRSFSITVTSNATIEILDKEGVLIVGQSNDTYVVNGSLVNYQFNAVSSTVPKGQKIKFYIDGGELPPGLELSESGVLFGRIADNLTVDFKSVQGTYDKDFYDVNPYDYGYLINAASGKTEISNGRISNVILESSGFGYLTNPNIIIGGSVDFVTITDSGEGYTSEPEVIFENSPVAGGRTAKGRALIVEDNSYLPFQGIFLNGGSGNINEATSIILDGGDSSSNVNEIIDGGTSQLSNQEKYFKVVGVLITDPGTGYITPPRVIFKNQKNASTATAVSTLKPGSGAILSANVNDGEVDSISIISQGSGYQEPPLISFDIPSAGSKVLSKIYKFKLTVSNGVSTDSKFYTIIVKSEDSLRVDTTFILSDENLIDTSRTFIQPPIWITGSILPEIRADNNYIFDLEVFDPTPNIGKIYFSLMNENFDGSESKLGPMNDPVNQNTYQIVDLKTDGSIIIFLNIENVFNSRDRIKIENISNPFELNGIYYVKKLTNFSYELYSDKTLMSKSKIIFLDTYSNNGIVRPYFSYLELDVDGGEIHGFIPYQSDISKTYNFTVKASRVIDDIESSVIFKQFQLVIKGNIDGEIEFVTPDVVGKLSPNEISLLKIEARSNLSSSSLNYQLIPGYGKNSNTNFIEIKLKEKNGKVLIDGYGINPFLSLDKGQVYKIDVELQNYSVSFRSTTNNYYNRGLRHSDGTIGEASQEKSNGYYIFNVPFDEATGINLVYTNIKKDGLFLRLKKFDSNFNVWRNITVNNFFNERDAISNNRSNIASSNDVFAVFLDYKKISFTLKIYNKQSLTWETTNIPIVQPLNPTNNSYWLDLEESNFGILEFQFVGIRGQWIPKRPMIVSSIPNNSVGNNNDYIIVEQNGSFDVLRKINGVWKLLEKLDTKGAFDPNIFFKKHDVAPPITNIPFDVWFKYDSFNNGLDEKININLQSLDSLPTDLTLASNGDIVGKISTFTSNPYRSFYSGNILYIPGDVVKFNNDLYVCLVQYRSSGNWFQDLNNWSFFNYTRRTFTSFDVSQFGEDKFSIEKSSKGTTIDKFLRFRIRAKDSQNVSFSDKDFSIEYIPNSNVNLTNIYLKPFLKKEIRDLYFNFITDPNIFKEQDIYRVEDKEFGVQRQPKMLLLSGLESAVADRFSSAVQRHYYERPLYFGEIKKAVGIANNTVEYELIYIEIDDPYEINDVSVVDSIHLPFSYATLTSDYSKIRIDDSSINVPRIDLLSTVEKEGTTDSILTDYVTTDLNRVFPSSITLMREELKKVTLEKTDNLLSPVEIEDWGLIPTLQTSGPNAGNTIDTDPVSINEDWGRVTERISVIDDFLLVIDNLVFDSNNKPLWMNTSQDGTGNPIGFKKSIPICYVKPGKGDEILSRIKRTNFDFKNLNFTIDRIIIESPKGEVGDKYIKFIDREII